MNLHQDKKVFNELLQIVSETMQIDRNIIEKDYFVALILKELILKDGNFIFKGGTCLSKCYKIINRFSEDIDLCYNKHLLSRGRKSIIKDTIKTIVENLGLYIINIDETKSGRDFNQYKIDYGAKEINSWLKQYIIVETSFQTESFPIEVKEVSSMIYDFLKHTQRIDIINMYRLEPFPINVQTLERTFIDKVYAICDYYLSNKIQSHSRHLYDLSKLINFIKISKVREILPQVRRARKENRLCYSAQDGVNINKLLEDIINKDVYKSDFELITSKIIYEESNYDNCKKVLKYIIDLNTF